MQENFKILGHRMKSLRMEKGISQTKMAEMVCLSQTHLSNIESGKASTTIQMLFKFSDVLDCKMKDFFVDFDVENNGENFENKKYDSQKNQIELEDALQILRLLKAVNIKGI